MKWIHLLFTSLLFLSSSAIVSGVGFTQVTLTDEPNRPLNTVIWYPARDASDKTIIGDNPPSLVHKSSKMQTFNQVLFQ